MTEHELKKPYANKEQQESLFWLLDALIGQCSLGIEHIYVHGDIVHKEPTEGALVLKAYHVYQEGK